MNQGSDGDLDPIGGPVDPDAIEDLLEENTALWLNAGLTVHAPPNSAMPPPSDPGSAYERLTPVKAGTEDEKRPFPYVHSIMGRPNFVATRGYVDTFFQSDFHSATFLKYGESLIPTHQTPDDDRRWLSKLNAKFYDDEQPEDKLGSTHDERIRAVLVKRGLRVVYHRVDTATYARRSRSGRRENPARSTRWVCESYEQVPTIHDYNLADYRRRHPEFPSRQDVPRSLSRRGAGKQPEDRSRSRGNESGRAYMSQAASSGRSSRRGSISSIVEGGEGLRGKREQYVEQELNYDADNVPRRAWSELDKGSATGFADGPKSWKCLTEGCSKNEVLNM